MKKLIIGAALATTLIGGVALAQQATGTAEPKTPGAHWLARNGDANGDGTVTRDEYLAQAAKRFDAMDTNKDGKVTPDEAKAAMQARWSKHGGHRGPGGPGGPGMMPPPGGPDGGPGGNFLARLDTNGDGKISRAEFDAPSDKRFDMLDTNKDGVIDQAELAAAQQKMKDRMQQMRGRWHHGQGAPGGDTPPPPPPAGQDTGN